MGSTIVQDNVTGTATDLPLSQNQGNVLSGQLAETAQYEKSLREWKWSADFLNSINKSRALYEDTASTIFIEDWADLNDWTLPATPGLQVSGNKLYSVGTQGANSGGNHSYALGASDNLRAVFKVTLPSLGASGGIMVGVNKNIAGAIPVAGGGSSFAVYFTGTAFIKICENGTMTDSVTPLSAGDWYVCVTVDATYISIFIIKSDGTGETLFRTLRSSFAVNNLYLFNSFATALTGGYIGICSARKGLQTIIPRTYGEGVMKIAQWTGDSTEGFTIYLPSDYDSRIPKPLAICFHGSGTKENDWSINSNMKLVQSALVSAGFIVLGCSLASSQSTWGRADSTLAYYNAYKYVRDNYAVSAVVIYANSMGGIESLNAIAENKIPCVAWAGTAITYDLKNMYDTAMFTPSIKSSYSIASDGSDYNAKTAGRDPALMNPITFRRIPMLAIAANDDTFVSKANNTDALISDVQNYAIEAVEITVPNGQNGHSFPVNAYLTTIVDFLKKYVMSV